MQEIFLDSIRLGGRAIAIYIVAIIMVKLMGKREVGQLSPLDFVVGVIIGSVAAAPMVDLELPLLTTLVPLVILGLLEILTSVLALNNKKIRLLLEDKPTVLIRNGEILTKNMAAVRMNIDELKQELRKNSIVNINEVAEGILEGCGTLSIIKKKEFQPLTPHDFQTVTLHNFDRITAAHAKKSRFALQNLVEQLDRRD